MSKDPKFAAKLAEAISPAQQLSIPISRAASPVSISSLDDSAAQGERVQIYSPCKVAKMNAADREEMG